MYKRILQFNLLNVLTYFMSLWSLVLIATTFGGDRSFEKYWMLNSFVLFVVSSIYPLRELVCSGLAVKDRVIKLNVSRAVFIAFCFGAILLLLISVAIFYYGNWVDGVDVLKQYPLVFFLLAFSFFLHEFLIAILIAVGNIRYPIFFRVLSAGLTILAIFVFSLDAFFTLATSVSLANLIGAGYAFYYLRGFQILIGSSSNWSSNVRFFIFVLTVNLFAQGYLLFYRGQLFDLNDRSLASFQYAFSLFAVGLNVVSIPATNYVWMRLGRGTIERSEFYFALLALSVIFLGLVLSFQPFVPYALSLILGRGNFDVAMVEETSDWLEVLLIALPFVLVTQTIYRIFLYLKLNSFVLLVGCAEAIFGSIWIWVFINYFWYKMFFLFGVFGAFFSAIVLLIVSIKRSPKEYDIVFSQNQPLVSGFRDPFVISSSFLILLVGLIQLTYNPTWLSAMFAFIATTAMAWRVGSITSFRTFQSS